MPGPEFFSLSLAIQAALGAGCLGYFTAYAGYRRDHRPEEAIFISLVFASIALLAFRVANPVGDIMSFVCAFLASLVSAAVWRKWGRSAWAKTIDRLGVHRDDGIDGAWSSIVQTDRRVGQISVHTGDGRVLHLINREKYLSAPWEGLYLGSDGAVVMVVEEEDLPNGLEEERSGISDDFWGTRMTYIPASEVKRVNIRMK